MVLIRRKQARRWAAITLLLLVAPSVARAAVFHLGSPEFGERDVHADLIADQELRTEPDGARSVLVVRIGLALADGGGVVASVDQTRLAFDCPGKRYRVLSEVLYAGIDPSARRTDKSPPAGQTPVAVEPGGDVEDIYLFACQGPRAVKPPMLGFQQQDLWGATAEAADSLGRMMARASRGGPPSVR